MKVIGEANALAAEGIGNLTLMTLFSLGKTDVITVEKTKW